MLLSDVSIKRPVFATVIGLLLVAIGAVSFTRLSLREYPDIDPPIVSVSVDYTGASGPCDFTDIGDILDCKFRYEQARKGKIELVRIV